MDADEPMEIYNLWEMEEKFKKHVQALEKQCYVEGEDIVIKLPDEVTDDDYRVRLDRCSTPEAILAWVHHLAEKKWVTVPVIERFVEVATEHHGIKIQTPG